MYYLHCFYLFIMLLVLSSCQQSERTQTKNFEDDLQRLPPSERYGPLFRAVQMQQVFEDGKTFVDCNPRLPTEDILANYRARRDNPDFDLEAFVLEHFELPRQYASGFKSDTSRSPRQHIDTLWSVLTRTPDEPTAGTLIGLPNPYIVPGGRFGEIYYWDSYFTMLGLVESGRTPMVRNMVDNFAFLIDSLGFVPNGNRSYFLTRSQPPFFALMVRLLSEHQDSVTPRDYLPYLEKEYAFWMEGSAALSDSMPATQHVVRLADDIVLNRYYDRGQYPRAEMYRQDVELAAQSARSDTLVYQHIRSACESGWDFSSRWLQDPNQLHTIRTMDIIPVDLNCLLYVLEQTLAQAYTVDGQSGQADRLAKKARDRAAAIRAFCWDGNLGYFRDYNFIEQSFTPVLSLAGAFPLFSEVASAEMALRSSRILRDRFLRAGGLLSTLHHTTQQWDAPNGWAPLQYISVAGLRRYGQDALAETIANRWLDNNQRVYRNTGKMVEKYNVVDVELVSGGGEYPVQDGFGWTNGVYLKLLGWYPQQRVQDESIRR